MDKICYFLKKKVFQTNFDLFIIKYDKTIGERRVFVARIIAMRVNLLQTQT